METIEARFKIVTPLFMSGADQAKAELRVPSIKGALRFWWRALNYDENIAELKRKEGEIFGSSEQDVGQSKVIIRLLDKNIESVPIQSKWNVNDWKSYVGYGLSENHEKDREKAPTYREYLKPGGSFNIRFDSVLGLDAIVRPLKVFCLIGGLGSRSRKGWGSVSAVEFNSDKEKWNIPKTRDEYMKELRDIIVNTDSQHNRLPAYSAISTETDVKVGKYFDSYDGAFRDIADSYKVFIRSIEKKSREGFGLPRKGVSDDRRASPLLIHIHQCGKEFFWVCLFLAAEFLPEQQMPRDEYRSVTEFMKQLKGDVI